MKVDGSKARQCLTFYNAPENMPSKEDLKQRLMEWARDEGEE